MRLVFCATSLGSNCVRGVTRVTAHASEAAGRDEVINVHRRATKNPTIVTVTIVRSPCDERVRKRRVPTMNSERDETSASVTTVRSPRNERVGERRLAPMTSERDETIASVRSARDERVSERRIPTMTSERDETSASVTVRSPRDVRVGERRRPSIGRRPTPEPSTSTLKHGARASALISRGAESR